MKLPGGGRERWEMKEALEDFRRTVETAAESLLGMTDEQCERRPAPGKWSAKEVVGHLIDSAANNHQRFVRAQFQDDLAFPGYAQEEWNATQHYQEEPWRQLVELWRLYNLHLLRVVAHISEEELRRPRRLHTLHRIAWKPVEESEPATLEYLIRDYIEHLKHHLGQIERADN